MEMFDTSSALGFSLFLGQVKLIHLQFKHLMEGENKDYSLSCMQSIFGMLL